MGDSEWLVSRRSGWLRRCTAPAGIPQPGIRAGWRVDVGSIDLRDRSADPDEAADAVELVRRDWERVQSQPVVVALAHSAPGYRFAARSADVLLVTPSDEDDARRIVGAIRDEESRAGRTGAGLGAARPASPSPPSFHPGLTRSVIRQWTRSAAAPVSGTG